MSGFILTAYAVFFTALIVLGLYLWIDRRRTIERLEALDLIPNDQP